MPPLKWDRELAKAVLVAMAKLRGQGKSVEWIGFQSYLVDGKRVTQLQLFELAKEQE